MTINLFRPSREDPFCHKPTNCTSRTGSSVALLRLTSVVEQHLNSWTLLIGLECAYVVEVVIGAGMAEARKVLAASIKFSRSTYR